MNMPKKIDITEVCPRDGFQNIKEFIPTNTKIKVVKSLIDAGFKRIEATSFVSPKWVAQMADSFEVMEDIKDYASQKGVIIVGLALNLRGIQDAIKAGVDEINYAISVSESHSIKNANKTNEQAFEQFREVIKMKGDKKLKLGLATSFGCPFEGKVAVEKVVNFAVKGIEMGADEIMLADTIGTANPDLIEDVVTKVKEEIPVDKISMHLHDTRGLALANSLTAMQNGIYKFETAAGGLGGCPFAPGASGNGATEDMLYMLDSMGIENDIIEDKLYEAIEIIKREVPTRVLSHLSMIERK